MSAIRLFVDRWERERPCDPYSGEFVSAMEWLSSESGLPEDTIWIVRRGRYLTTALSTADALVEALGHPEWFYDGTLTVSPNPKASAEIRARCCGGSAALDPAAAA